MSNKHRTVMEDPVPERSTYLLTADLVDETGVAIPKAALVSVKLTLYNLDDLAIVNLVNGMDVKDANRGALTESTVDGVATTTLKLHLTPDDNAMVSTAKKTETRIALVEWTFNAAATPDDEGVHEIEYRVVNIAKRPAA